ncbi:SDR family NAD(P)-dependent oxidoreductase [Polyangium mundeleinium]|uniref:SDR family NAD(P)-dependent oxidoreductase n=1 Tax=Polyangium mundeleinium TaxID=2995306 RepID=A0ABT5EQ79_9BACT|nr:SDR family NAD(P)-dependent oxidoreductase [Polyangium mundeleinium]MDC0742930.1 SDR family NAD(P)-dependent oxidoreductase [Polyangium mundeleinium]
MSASLMGKVAAITGVQGLGKHAAVRFARAGAQVVIGDIDETAAEEAVQLVTDAGGQAIFVRTDVSSEADVAAMMAAATRHYGRLDTLVTAAAVLLGPSLPVERFTISLWERVLSVNLTGTFLCIKHAAPLMQRSGGGVILCLASDAGVRGPGSSVAYAASKGGVHGLAMAVAPQVAPWNIRIHVVLPGVMATPMRLSIAADRAVIRGESPEEAVQREKAAPVPSPTAAAAMLVDLATGRSSARPLLVSIDDWLRAGGVVDE